jgi:hypothetical protein
MYDHTQGMPYPKPADLAAVADSYENYVLKFGRASITAESVIWNGGGAYTGYLAAENKVQVVSDSVDDKAAGGGALTVRLIGQGDDGIEKREDITLNGTTPVESLEDFAIVYGFLVRTTEDANQFTGPNHGTIDAYETGTPANVMAKINPTNGSALMCVYRVPVDKYAEIKHMDVYPVAAQPVVLSVNIKPLPNLAWLKVAEADFDQTTLNFILSEPVFIAPRADINLSVSPSVPTNVGALFELRLYEVDITT